MGGSCISKPKRKHKQNLYIDRSPNPNLNLNKNPNNKELIPVLSQTVSVNEIALMASLPYYRGIGGWMGAGGGWVDLARVAGALGVDEGVWGVGRMYGYGHSQARKQFSDGYKMGEYKKVVQIDGNTILQISLLQALTLSPPTSQKILTTPTHNHLLIPTKQPNPNTSHQCPEPTIPPTPSSFYLITAKPQPQPKQGPNSAWIYQICIMQDLEDVKKLVRRCEELRGVALDRDCVVNGVIYRESQGRGRDGCALMDVFGVNQMLYPSDILLCYINPCIPSNPEHPPTTTPQYTTYLQLKCLLQSTKGSKGRKDIARLFRPSSILEEENCEPVSVYILLFCLKIVMMHTQAIGGVPVPIAFLSEFLSMQPSGEQSLLLKVTNIMKFYYSIGILHEQPQPQTQTQTLAHNNNSNKQQTVLNCCRNILQICSINTHILLDAYLLQFGLEIDEKLLPVRQNPLYRLDGGKGKGIRYRFRGGEAVDCGLVGELREIWGELQGKVVGVVAGKGSKEGGVVEGIYKKAQEQMAAVIKNKYPSPKSKLKINQPNLQWLDPHTPTQTPTEHILLQSTLSLSLHSFITNLLLLSPNPLTPPDKAQLKPLRKSWQQILQPFTSWNCYGCCSGELALTVLTFDCLLRVYEEAGWDEIQGGLEKCVDIWCRIYRDPRARYRPYLSNCWITFVVKIITEVRIKMDGHNYLSQNLLHLHNMIQCLYSNQNMTPYGHPSQPEWILLNLPIRSMSGIYYARHELLAPVTHEPQPLLTKTGSSLNSLLENPSELSSKSNYSQSFSNTNSSYSKTKRRNRNRMLEGSRFLENQAMRTGVYVWGKGVNCYPLLYPFAKNFTVFKIACGNYHAVIVTDLGIFGWGENGSGQLGGPSPNQNAKLIKRVLLRTIKPEDSIQISCGNEHTAILFKGEPLVMFGQPEGGIISGNGQLFDTISCGGLHTIGIRNGEVYSWGRGQGGQLGHRPELLTTKVKKQSTDFYLDGPKKIPNLPPIKKSVCGDAHSVLLSEQGDAYVFGFSYQGQLGLGITGDSESFQIFEPVKLQFPKKKIKVADIYAGSTFTFFKSTQGQIYSCGLNDCNQLGIQKMMKVFQKKKYLGQQKKPNDRKIGQAEFSKPNKIQIFNADIKVQQIYCGQNHCLASLQYMKKNRMVMGWGLNKQYQISAEFLPENITPRTIDNLSQFHFDAFCCGSNFSLGLISGQRSMGLAELEGKIEDLLRLTINLEVKF